MSVPTDQSRPHARDIRDNLKRAHQKTASRPNQDQEKGRAAGTPTKMTSSWYRGLPDTIGPVIQQAMAPPPLRPCDFRPQMGWLTPRSPPRTHDGWGAGQYTYLHNKQAIAGIPNNTIMTYTHTVYRRRPNSQQSDPVPFHTVRHAASPCGGWGCHIRAFISRPDFHEHTAPRK
jgi:hypothetical protein